MITKVWRHQRLKLEIIVYQHKNLCNRKWAYTLKAPSHQTDNQKKKPATKIWCCVKLCPVTNGISEEIEEKNKEELCKIWSQAKCVSEWKLQWNGSGRVLLASKSEWFNSLTSRGWFYMLSQPKRVQQARSSSNAAVHSSVTRATDSLWQPFWALMCKRAD